MGPSAQTLTAATARRMTARTERTIESAVADAVEESGRAVIHARAFEKWRGEILRLVLAVLGLGEEVPRDFAVFAAGLDDDGVALIVHEVNVLPRERRTGRAAGPIPILRARLEREHLAVNYFAGGGVVDEQTGALRDLV